MDSSPFFLGSHKSSCFSKISVNDLEVNAKETGKARHVLKHGWVESGCMEILMYLLSVTKVENTDIRVA